MIRTTYQSPAARGRRARLRTGIGLMVVALAGALAAFPFGVARAQEPEAQPLTVTKHAYWSRSLGHVAPRSLTDHFPPTVVCLVAPDFCNSPLADVLAQGDQIAQGAQPEAVIPAGDPDVLAQVMVGGGDHLATGVIAGARRYLSALQFDTPDVPDDHRVTTYELRLTPVPDFTFHFDSPAFRQAVLAVLRGIQTEDPEAFMAEFEKVGQDPHGFANENHLGVEACPIVGDVAWEAGPNQDAAASAPERDSDERTGTDLRPKQVDCALGANGAQQDDGTWVFDLTLAANAWAEERIANNGVLLRPVLPPNLAYGDPDLSTFDQVVFYSPASAETDAQKPMFALETREKSKPVTIASRTVPPEVRGVTATNPTFTEVFGAIDTPATPIDAPAPKVTPPPQQGSTLPAGLGTPVTEWWVWMLLPMFLAGVYLTAQALTIEPALVMAERAGAMTRLIEARKRGELI